MSPTMDFYNALWRTILKRQLRLNALNFEAVDNSV